MSSNDLKMWRRAEKRNLWCNPIKKIRWRLVGLLGGRKPFEISLSSKKERNNCIVLVAVCLVMPSCWNQIKRSSCSNNKTNCWMRFWYCCPFIVSEKKVGRLHTFLKWRTIFWSSMVANSIQHSREGFHTITADNFVHWRNQTNAPRPRLKKNFV